MNLFNLLSENGILVTFVSVCDLIKLDFLANGDTICIHIQDALFRVFKNDRLIISSNDMFVPAKNYKKKPFKKFKWDVPGNSLFDEQVDAFSADILNKKVESVKLIGQDLFINLSFNYKIQVLANTTQAETEVFRIFKKGDLDSHFVIENE